MLLNAVVDITPHHLIMIREPKNHGNDYIFISRSFGSSYSLPLRSSIAEDIGTDMLQVMDGSDYYG